MSTETLPYTSPLREFIADRALAIAASVIVLVAIVPTEYLEFYWGPVPLRFIIYAAVVPMVVAVCPGSLLSRVAFVALAYMGLVGLLRQNSAKFFVIDAIYFAGVPCGILYASLPLPTLARHIRSLVCVASVGGLAVLVALLLGFITPSDESDRLYTRSMFETSFLISLLLPFAEHFKARFRLLAFIVIVAFSIVSATRSVFIVTCVSLVATLWIGRRLFTAAALGFVLIGFVLVEMNPGSESAGGSIIAQRFASTVITDEIRYEEASDMLSQTWEDGFWTGRGLGSRFESPIPDPKHENEGLAFAPHIGILTLILKGGVLIFALFVVGPALLALRRSFSFHRGVSIAAGWSMLIYVMQASTSGGWSFSCLYLMGFTVAIVLRSFPQDSEEVSEELEVSEEPG